MPADVPAHLAARLDEEPDDHPGRQSFGFVGACVDAGLEDAHILALALRHRPTREKYGGRARREVERSLGKHRDATSPHLAPTSPLRSSDPPRPSPPT